MKVKVKAIGLITVLFMVIGTGFILLPMDSGYANKKTYKIGDRGPGGGYVFYDKGNSKGGWRYLEAAPKDLGKAKWGCDKTKISDTNTGIGTGKANTTAISKACKDSGIAAKVAAAYRGGGKNDWSLPSKAELNLMYKNLKKAGIGDFATGGYWSSSEHRADLAWFQNFYNGNQMVSNKNATLKRVRAVRAFSSAKKEKKEYTKTYKIGDRGPGGGYVFYDKGNSKGGWRYLEAAPKDLGKAKWGCYKTELSGTNTGIGTSRANTKAISKACKDSGIAAKVAAAYRGGGKNDWSLPSKAELNLMYKNLKKAGIGNFAGKLYWSSSERDGYTAWLQDFGRGLQNFFVKYRAGRVRAVRNF